MSAKRGKLKKEILIRLLTAFVILFVLAGATIAWFSYNLEVSGREISVSMVDVPGIVIEDAPEKLKTSSRNSVEFQNIAARLSECTHIPEDSELLSTNETGLICLKNPNDVDADTGYAKSGKILQFENVEVSAYSQYYKDYKVYIAALNEPMQAEAVYASLRWYNMPGAEDKGYLNAATIDFYVNSVSPENYAGKRNLKSVDPVTGKTEQINLISEDLTIPLNTSGEYITLIMRCYFDGDLQKSGTEAYVRAKDLILRDFGMAVEFEVVRK